MKIPFYDLASLNDKYRHEILGAMARVFDSGHLILGQEVESFEKEFSEYCGTKFAVGVGNGLDAIYFILSALGIGPGDEVIVPSNSYIATWLAVTRTGATVIPVEPDPATFCIDPARIEASITKKTRAVLAIHLYGKVIEIDQLQEVTSRYGIPLIEDAAQAHGGSINGKRVGSFGKAAAFSFYPSKNLGGLGDGGAVTTDDEQLAKKVRLLRNYGSEAKYFNEVLGWNSRLDEIQAAVLRFKLKNLDLENRERIAIANRYSDQLGSFFREGLPKTFDGLEHVWHLFVVQTPLRDHLQSRLKDLGIETMIHYPIAPHLQNCYRYLGFRQGSFPISEKIHREVLSLPLWPGMKDEYLERVVESVGIVMDTLK